MADHLQQRQACVCLCVCSTTTHQDGGVGVGGGNHKSNRCSGTWLMGSNAASGTCMLRDGGGGGRGGSNNQTDVQERG